MLYCVIPHFITALVRRDRSDLGPGPLILLGSEGVVVDTSAEAAACGVLPGMPARAAEIRCPQAQLVEADMARCRAEWEALMQLLEQYSAGVEPNGWGAAYADLDNLARDQARAVPLLQQIGQTVRRELGGVLQPALGWDKSKFTAQAAARRTQPGRLRAVDSAQERDFLHPLPIALLPLAGDALQRLRFLGLYTLGQYADLPLPAVWQQFGPAGKLAYRCARGEDDRPVVPRQHAPHLGASLEFETAQFEREWLVAALRNLVTPLLPELRDSLRGCGTVRLVVHLERGLTHERERAFLLPVSDEGRILQALEELLDTTRGAGEGQPAGIAGLAVALEQIQDAVPQQLALFSLQDERGAQVQEVQRYLATRFGANRLRRAVLTQPRAPLPEWRIGWQAAAA